jgi:preprotein translocase subunit Sec63
MAEGGDEADNAIGQFLLVMISAIFLGIVMAALAWGVRKWWKARQRKMKQKIHI